MKSTASLSPSMPSIGFRGCRRSGLMPRNDSETGKSSAGLMPTSMASTVPKLRDGSGRTNQHELAGGGRGLRHGAATPSSLNLAIGRLSGERISDERSSGTFGLALAAKHRVDQHQHHSHPLDGWRTGGELGASGNTDGDGPCRLLSVARLPAI